MDLVLFPFFFYWSMQYLKIYILKTTTTKFLFNYIYAICSYTGEYTGLGDFQENSPWKCLIQKWVKKKTACRFEDSMERTGLEM